MDNSQSSSSVTLRSVRALVLHLCLPGLPEVGTPYSDMWPDYQITFLHTRPCYAMSSSQSDDCQIPHGNVCQVDLVQNGPIGSAEIIIMFPLRLCGGKLLVEVTRERRYSPSQLRVNVDDGTHTQSFNGLFSRITWVGWYQKDKPFWILLKQR